VPTNGGGPPTFEKLRNRNENGKKGRTSKTFRGKPPPRPPKGNPDYTFRMGGFGGKKGEASRCSERRTAVGFLTDQEYRISKSREKMSPEEGSNDDRLTRSKKTREKRVTLVDPPQKKKAKQKFRRKQQSRKEIRKRGGEIGSKGFQGKKKAAYHFFERVQQLFWENNKSIRVLPAWGEKEISLPVRRKPQKSEGRRVRKKSHRSPSSISKRFPLEKKQKVRGKGEKEGHWEKSKNLTVRDVQTPTERTLARLRKVGRSPTEGLGGKTGKEKESDTTKETFFPFPENKTLSWKKTSKKKEKKKFQHVLTP